MASDTQRRVKFCLVVATLDFLALVMPKLEGIVFYLWILLGVLLNVIIVWLILRGVKSMANESDHLMVVAYSKRWIATLGGLLTVATLAASLSGVFKNQAIPFVMFGYIFLMLVPMKILDLPVGRRIREMGDDD